MCVISPGSSRIPSLPLAITATPRAERWRHLKRDHEWEAATLVSPAPEHRSGRQSQSQALGEPGGPWLRGTQAAFWKNIMISERT